MVKKKAKNNNESEDNKKFLVFKPGEEYKIKIEQGEAYRNSLFWNIYKRAARNLVEIINENKITEKKENSKNNTFFKDTYNNIIAFTGERGTGKSSSMISFTLALKDLRSNEKEIVFDKKIDDIIRECHFEEIGVIDPSMFEEKDNILEIIIAKMFSRFNQRIAGTASDIDHHNKRELLKAFQDVYENLRTIGKEKHERLDGEIIETLSNLASGSNLKDSIVDLVESYLKFMGPTNNRNYFLLVIDDFDLNIQHAGEMAEQIRKYLVIPRVIILLAVKIDQFLSIIEQSYREKFKIMLHKEVKRMPTEEPQNMAYLYLEKLIPEDRRLYLPGIRKIENKEVCIRIEKEGEECIKDPLEDTILKLIYEKTGLIFLKHDYDFHFLIPENLRDLNSLYVMLQSLKSIDDVSQYEERKKILKENIGRFEDYFFNNWIKNKLCISDQRIIEDFIFADIRQKNKFVVSAVCNRNEMDKKITRVREEPEDYEFINIIDKRNNPLNVSLGDILFFLKNVLLFDDSFNTNRFIFAIKTIYSLIIYKLLFIEEDYGNVQVLLGGAIYNPEDIDIIRRERVSYNKNDCRRDHFEILYNRNVRTHFAKDKHDPKLEWIHYFLKLVGKEKEERNYRTSEDVYYDRNTNLNARVGKVEYATFDILAFVLFVYTPYRLLQRIHGEDEINKTDFCKEIENWRDKHRAVLPIYSIEFLERILLSGLKRLKKAGDDYYSFLNNFFDNLANSIKDILNTNKHLGNAPLNAYAACPVIKVVTEEKNLHFYINGLRITKELIEYFEAIINDLKRFAKQEENEIKNARKEDAEAKVEIKDIKEETNFLNDVEIKKVYELKDVFKKVGELKNKIDEYKDKVSLEEKEAVLTSFKKIITLFENGVKKLNE